MMKLLGNNQVFYEELVNMYYDMCVEVYSDRIIGNKQNYYREVDKWSLDDTQDIILVVNDKEVIGFSKSAVALNKGLYEPHYFTELIYIKPSYRKSRALKMLADNILMLGDELKMTNVMGVRIENGFAKSLSKYMKKKYTVKDTFLTLEKRNTK